MVLYRIKYSTDANGENYRETKSYDDFSEMKKKAKELSKLTNRMIIIEWMYPSSAFWGVLKACPSESDINTVKEMH